MDTNHLITLILISATIALLAPLAVLYVVYLIAHWRSKKK